jgi:hypothetical protein
MRFPLSAAADVTFHGDRYLHACMFQQFSGGRRVPRINLVARARQFSSFILVVGKIASADVFEPECACIIKDKDDLTIPLLLETIPTPKEFADAIESLSPEQQRFCQVRRVREFENARSREVTVEREDWGECDSRFCFILFPK